MCRTSGFHHHYVPQTSSCNFAVLFDLWAQHYHYWYLWYSGGILGHHI